jgi:Fungal specific transcription factor domain
LSHNEGIVNGCLEVILPQAISNEYFFHALVAQSRTISLMAQGKSALQDPAVIFHRGQALVGIKAALSNVDDDVLPLAVMHMVSLDVREYVSSKIMSTLVKA